jgi:DNA gyrase subunit A
LLANAVVFTDICGLKGNFCTFLLIRFKSDSMTEEIQGSNAGNIIPINIEDEMRGAYIDYSMSVIISRALPDVRDGLKPVHRRILYGMDELGVNYNKSYKKSARIVGEVLGKFHPHGDSAVYDTMVRMAQEWSLRYPLVDGQGNFGSIDGDSPAAMRYTEARLKRIAEELLADINKETVDFQPNFDDSLQEPTVLPAKLPNLLLNGSAGIAVGMATNMAPHNLSEVADGIVAFLDNPEISIPELMAYVLAPDFPTGATIYGYQGVKSAFETGRGRIVMRGNATFETSKTGKDQIVVTEIPYLVNKASMIEKIADLINDKRIEGISEIRDESDRTGMRIVFDLKRDAVPNVVLNNLYKYSPLQSSFGVNNVALVKGRPMTLNLKDLIKYYVEHRLEVIVRRTKYDLREARKRAHILEGLLIALDNLDAVIELIRSSRDPEVAKNGLIERFGLSEIQAKAILELRLQRLTGLERDKIVQEYQELQNLIADLENILADELRRFSIIREEVIELKGRYGDARRTQIVHADEEFTMEDMIADDEMLITISHAGYIKRTPLSEYRTQGRGGVGSRGVSTKEDDYTEHVFSATNHNYLLFFTENGKCYWLKVYAVPEGSKISKGRPIQNLINIEQGDRIRAVINVKTLADPDYINNNYIVMCTEDGTIKKTSLESYSRPRQNGIIAISINEGDRLLDVALTNGDSDIVIASKAGRSVRFHESRVRPMGRNAAGVRGITLEDDDYPDNKAIGMVCISKADTTLLVVSERGFGKRSDIEDYRVTNRGGKGVTTLKITDKTGHLVAIKEVSDNDDLMIMNKSGITIRISLAELRVMGRNTQGVKLIRLNDNDAIGSVTKIEREEDQIADIADTEMTTLPEGGTPDQPSAVIEE